MQLSIGDVVNLSFEDEVFDKIYSVNTIYFWSSADKGLSEIKRVLKPGGMFVNTVYSKEFLESWSYTKYGFVKYTLDELKNLAVNHGFTLDIVTVVKDKSYCFVLRKPITADR